jgi:glycosyltransferase involved in cell wall biosynthesis
MKILVVHNAYQHRGGEDSVIDAEISLLRAHGHEVAIYSRHNDEVAERPKVSTAIQTLWSSRTTHDLAGLIQDFQPAVIHVHNTLPLVSPSIYWGAARARVPVVQTLHNFRLMCLSALYLREGRVCEDCVGNLPWLGVMRKCYRGSMAASAVLAGMLTLHRGFGTYRNKVTRYIALNDFCRNKFIEGGLPADRVVVKPNFVDWDTNPKSPLSQGPRSNALLFVGRLSQEKGISVLMQAAGLLGEVAGLRVAGSGPEEHLVDGVRGVTPLGPLTGDEVRSEMERALALVMPSIWYENFPRTLVEAFACGLPVIASRLGAMAELVVDGETGLLFEPGNPQDLADKMAWAQANPDKMAEMGRNAWRKYEAEFTAARNYEQLMAIYEEAIQEQRNAK